MEKISGQIEDVRGKKIHLSKTRLPFPIPPGGSGIVELREDHGTASLHDLKEIPLNSIEGIDHWELCPEEAIKSESGSED